MRDRIARRGSSRRFRLHGHNRTEWPDLSAICDLDALTSSMQEAREADSGPRRSWPLGRPGNPPVSLGPHPGEGVGVAAARIDRFSAVPGGQVGERLVVEDLEHCVAHVEHDIPQRAGCLIRA